MLKRRREVSRPSCPSSNSGFSSVPARYVYRAKRAWLSRLIKMPIRNMLRRWREVSQPSSSNSKLCKKCRFFFATIRVTKPHELIINDSVKHFNATQLRKHALAGCRFCQLLCREVEYRKIVDKRLNPTFLQLVFEDNSSDSESLLLHLKEGIPLNVRSRDGTSGRLVNFF